MRVTRDIYSHLLGGVGRQAAEGAEALGQPRLRSVLSKGADTLLATSDEKWDGHRAVRTNSGETGYRVRGNRMVDTNTGETAFRVRDDGRVVDVNTGETVYRLRG